MSDPTVIICEGTGLTWAEHSPLRAIARESRLPYRVAPYPSQFYPFPYDNLVRNGIDITLREVRDQKRREPDRPIVVIGYSLGARIAGDALVRLSQEYRTRLSGVLISDPRQPRTGMEITSGWRLPGISFTGEREPIACPVLRVTHNSDPISAGRGGLLGYLFHHSGYHRMQYDRQPLFRWVASQLRNVPNRTVVI